MRLEFVVIVLGLDGDEDLHGRVIDLSALFTSVLSAFHYPI